MKAHITEDLLIEKFDSLAEAIETAKYRNKHPTYKRNQELFLAKIDEFETMNLAEMIDDIRPARVANNATKTIESWRYAGGAISVPRFIATRNPAIFRQKKKVKDNLIRVAVIGSTGWNTTRQTIASAGKKIVEAIMSLEASGYDVELTMATIHDDVGRSYSAIVPLKPAGKRFNLGRLGNVFLSDAFQRGVDFSLYCGADVDHTSYLGYARPKVLAPHLQKAGYRVINLQELCDKPDRIDDLLEKALG